MVMLASIATVAGLPKLLLPASRNGNTAAQQGVLLQAAHPDSNAESVQQAAIAREHQGVYAKHPAGSARHNGQCPPGLARSPAQSSQGHTPS